MTRAIIPAAGFGTRMNMKHNESKEMLYDHKVSGPVIDYSFYLCDKYKLHPLVITREEKTDLIEHCEDLGVDTLIISPEGEWPNTVLASVDYWDDHNVLIFPDTRFDSTRVIKYMVNDLKLGNRYSFGVHNIDPEESSKWCIVENSHITEKPRYIKSAWAMGLIGFNSYEDELFEHLAERQSFLFIDASFQYLDYFTDITRTGKLKY